MASESPPEPQRRRRRRPNILDHPRAQEVLASEGARMITACNGATYFCRTSNTTRIPLFLSYDCDEHKTCSSCGITGPLIAMHGHLVTDGRHRYIIVMDAKRMSDGEFRRAFSARRCRNLHVTLERVEPDIHPMPGIVFSDEVL